MNPNSWKSYERRIASYFNTHRTPLSGMNSRHSASDTLHVKLFVDCKMRREFRTVWRYFKSIEGLARKEEKLPALITKIQGGKDLDSLITVRLRDLKPILQELELLV